RRRPRPQDLLADLRRPRTHRPPRGRVLRLLHLQVRARGRDHVAGRVHQKGQRVGSVM
ncbi:hypothetical protein LTR16_011307, partial [Cryomyces antarcticus]